MSSLISSNSYSYNGFIELKKWDNEDYFYLSDESTEMNVWLLPSDDS